LIVGADHRNAGSRGLANLEERNAAHVVDHEPAALVVPVVEKFDQFQPPFRFERVSVFDGVELQAGSH
jgi:hypothetical protein